MLARAFSASVNGIEANQTITVVIFLLLWLASVWNLWQGWTKATLVVWMPPTWKGIVHRSSLPRGEWLGAWGAAWLMFFFCSLGLVWAVGKLIIYK